jgi:hypothetical protein
MFPSDGVSGILNLAMVLYVTALITMFMGLTLTHHSYMRYDFSIKKFGDLATLQFKTGTWFII